MTVVLNAPPVDTTPAIVPPPPPPPPPPANVLPPLIEVAVPGPGGAPGLTPGGSTVGPPLMDFFPPAGGGSNVGPAGATPVGNVVPGPASPLPVNVTPSTADMFAPPGTLAPSIAAGLVPASAAPVGGAVNDVAGTRAANDARVNALRDPAALDGNGFFPSTRPGGFFGPEMIGPGALVAAVGSPAGAPPAASPLAEAAPPVADTILPADVPTAGTDATAAAPPVTAAAAPVPAPAPPAVVAPPLAVTDPSPPPAQARLYSPAMDLDAQRAEAECQPTVKTPVKPKPHKRIVKRPIGAPDAVSSAEKVKAAEKTSAAKAFSDLVDEARDTAKPKVKVKPKPKPKAKAKPAPAVPQC
ncbi:MAG: hypothetical protein MUF53_13085 [Gemmatimonadaceae bacterium]|nr:hypothetical protein [Gemmatimonadaceae bacterium]